ncbi:hypothetical protein L21TH_1151 [Caldisalinibacter kiritimatiensis]|uniref:Uncharacterized protein n=1 Tax=Caldisalinibacter kiritimatiensis TaxID=1304284 RepID=R1CEP6_9FIRM|nr:hypothetical protein L21TH_1151 [Caldisalinibacter kiritimatiensis]
MADGKGLLGGLFDGGSELLFFFLLLVVLFCNCYGYRGC